MARTPGPRTPGPPYPPGSADERELFLRWLAFLRANVIRRVEGLSEQDARWTPDGALIPLLGIINHLTRMEWRWIDGEMLGADVSRSEAEFRPGPELTVAAAIEAYRQRAAATAAAVRSLPLTAPCRRVDRDDWDDQQNLRWVLLHIIHETAQHGGHADATRELLDGFTGE
jgi:uncharacterized damage-inducible protein DinB